MAAPGATGDITLGVAPFRDAGPPAALPQPGQPVSTTLRDLEQRSFWLTVLPSGAVQTEAAGRALADLRLWRDGRLLSGLEPAITSIEPVPGHRLTNARLMGKAEPGTYLVVAYGGPAATWTDNDAGQPLHVRAGASDALALGWAGGAVGPFGSEVFTVPAGAALLRLSLPEAATAELRTARATAGIVRDSRAPVARLVVEPGREATVEVRGRGGAALHPARVGTAGTGNRQAWHLLDFRRGRRSRRRRGAAHRVAGARGPLGQAAADRRRPVAKPDREWRLARAVNLRGPTTLLARSAGGPVSLRTSGVAVRGGRQDADLPEGVYGLTLAPQDGALGALEFVLGPPIGAPALATALPPDPVLPLGIQTVAAGERLRLQGGTAPGMRLGLSGRPVPVALAEGPLAVTLGSGAGLTVPVRLAAGGVLSVDGAGRRADTLRQVTDGRRAGRHAAAGGSCADGGAGLAPRAPGTPSAIPAPQPPETHAPWSPARLRSSTWCRTNPSRSRWRCRRAGCSGSRRWAGCTRAAGCRQRSFPDFAMSEADGVGENMLIQRALRAGSYQVQVQASESAGRAGLLATPAPLLETATLRPAGSVRATLPAGTGGVVPVLVETAQTLHLDVASLGAAWRGRVEDAEGWPLIVPGALDGIEQAMTPGRYRIVVEPSPVTRQVVLRLRTIAGETPTTVEGHGPHPLPFAQRQTATWRELDAATAPRTPDSWMFTLQGRADVKLTLSDTMAGLLQRIGSDEPARRIVRRFAGPLEAGQYRLDVSSLGRNDRADYALTLDSTELQPGVPRSVGLPATLPFALAAPRVVSLTSFGTTPVKAVLRDSTGRVLDRAGPRRDDWNIAVSRPLPAGAYTLELLAATAPETTRTPLRDGPPRADDADSSDGAATDGDSATSGDDQAAQTAASQAADAVPAPRKPDDTADDAPVPQVEVRLALPPLLDPLPAPATARVLVGAGVHVLGLVQPVPGGLVLAQARSTAALMLTLERQGAEGWTVVARDDGLVPTVASPSDDDPRPWRSRPGRWMAVRSR